MQIILDLYYNNIKVSSGPGFLKCHSLTLLKDNIVPNMNQWIFAAFNSAVYFRSALNLTVVLLTINSQKFNVRIQTF